MGSYKPTKEEKTLIQELESFRDLITEWSQSRSPQLRSQLNRELTSIREIVRLAGCHRTLTVTPPPAIGGLVVPDIDPFSHIFEPIYGSNLHQKVIDMLDQTIGVIHSGKFQERKAALVKTKGRMGPISGSKVFLVHGHDEHARESTARFLEQLNLEPIILHEQPSAGRTIIEKIEEYAEVAFAVVLLTPDDKCTPQKNGEAIKYRARQNVVMELGYFLAKLGRKSVAALVKNEVEKPSDYDGVVYIPMDDAGAWKLTLARELKTAGLNIDMNDVV